MNVFEVHENTHNILNSPQTYKNLILSYIHLYRYIKNMSYRDKRDTIFLCQNCPYMNYTLHFYFTIF